MIRRRTQRIRGGWLALALLAPPLAGARGAAAGDEHGLPGPLVELELDARGGLLALAWFTLGADGTARVRSALSRDGGETFEEPTDVAVGEVEGRVDLVFDEHGTRWVSWLGGVADEAGWWLAALDPEGALRGPFRLVAASLHRRSGIARLAAAKDALWFAWTEAGPPTRVRALRVPTRRP